MSEAADSPKPREPKRRFLRFGLKTLLLFTAVVAVWLGIVTDRARRQRRAAEAISEAGGEFWYDYQTIRNGLGTSPGTGSKLFEGGRPDEYSFSAEAQIPGPEWLRNILGDDYFITPVCLFLRPKGVVDQDLLSCLGDLPEIEVLWVWDVKLRNEDLAHFRHLTKLRSLMFGPRTLSSIVGTHDFEFLSKCCNLRDLTVEGPCFGDSAAAHLRHATDSRGLYLYDTAIGDEGLACFGAMQNLEVLGLSRTRITDAGLAHLKPLTKLTYLSINGTQVTDAGVEHLASLGGLQRIELSETPVSKQGLEKLKAALPRCTIIKYR